MATKLAKTPSEIWEESMGESLLSIRHAVNDAYDDRKYEFGMHVFSSPSPDAPEGIIVGIRFNCSNEEWEYQVGTENNSVWLREIDVVPVECAMYAFDHVLETDLDDEGWRYMIEGLCTGVITKSLKAYDNGIDALFAGRAYLFDQLIAA